MDAHRKTAIIRSLEGVGLALVLLVALIGLLVTLRIAGELRDEQEHLRGLAATTRLLLDQHDAQNQAAEERLQDAIGSVETLLDRRLDRLVEDIRRLRFEVETSDGRTVIVERTIRDRTPPASEEATPGRSGEARGQTQHRGGRRR